MRAKHSRRAGITLIEMLVAIAISLMVLLAVITVFDQLNTSMNASKATIEQAGELRNVTARLQADLDGMTASTAPWTPVNAGDGYFEYIEQPGRDYDFDADFHIDFTFDSAQPLTSFWGDYDDILMFTSRSTDRPFLGRYDHDNNPGTDPVIIESDLAEIIWWVWPLGDFDSSGTAGDHPNELGLFRRVLLIRPDLNNATTGALVNNNFNLVAFYANNDISVRSSPTQALTPINRIVANSLADLTLRQNRFGHHLKSASGVPLHLFPHAVRHVAPGSTNVTEFLPLAGTAQGLDMVLDKVIGFDVKVYDPLAPLQSHPSNRAVLAPGDIGWHLVINPTDPDRNVVVGRGAYVDLGYTVANWSNVSDVGHRTMSYYSGRPNPKSLLDRLYIDSNDDGTMDLGYATYSTWPRYYEQDGLSQDNDDSASDAIGATVDLNRDGVADKYDLLIDRDVNNNGIIDHLDLDMDGEFDATEQSADATLVGDVNEDSQIDVLDVFDPDEIKDEGSDGFDETGALSLIGTDHPSETETYPPYPHPYLLYAGPPNDNYDSSIAVVPPEWGFPALRGIQVRIRVMEVQSRQVRQATVIGDFTPE